MHLHLLLNSDPILSDPKPIKSLVSTKCQLLPRLWIDDNEEDSSCLQGAHHHLLLRFFIHL